MTSSPLIQHFRDFLFTTRAAIEIRQVDIRRRKARIESDGVAIVLNGQRGSPALQMEQTEVEMCLGPTGDGALACDVVGIRALQALALGRGHRGNVYRCERHPGLDTHRKQWIAGQGQGAEPVLGREIGQRLQGGDAHQCALVTQPRLDRLEQAQVVVYRRPGESGETLFSSASGAAPRAAMEKRPNALPLDLTALTSPLFLYLWRPGL
ncbi:MAG: hypothetical protein L0H73_11820 [Nitrococcus sp.]|nr:hypothetical protein [Nitrococcus sp.]